MSFIELPAKRMPSKGKTYTFKKMVITPMVYKEILDYQYDLEKSNNVLSDYLCQLKHLILSNQNGGDLLLCDVPCIMAIKAFSSTCKEISSTLTFNYMCPVHKRKEEMTVTLDQLKFNDIDKDFLRVEQVMLNNKYYDIKIPTVNDFIYVADNFKTLMPVNFSLKLLTIISMFKDVYEEGSSAVNQIIEDITNAQSSDIIVLEWLYNKINSSFEGFMAKCKNEGGEPVTVKVNSLLPVTEIFQNILLCGVSEQIPLVFREDNSD